MDVNSDFYKKNLIEFLFDINIFLGKFLNFFLVIFLNFLDKNRNILAINYLILPLDYFLSLN